MTDPNEAAIKRVLDLCDFWDGLTKTESPTTKQIREALGPEAIERALNPCKTVDLDGTPQQYFLDGTPFFEVDSYEYGMKGPTRD